MAHVNVHQHDKYGEVHPAHWTPHAGVPAGSVRLTDGRIGCGTALSYQCHLFFLGPIATYDLDADPRFLVPFVHYECDPFRQPRVDEPVVGDGCTLGLQRRRYVQTHTPGIGCSTPRSAEIISIIKLNWASFPETT